MRYLEAYRAVLMLGEEPTDKRVGTHLSPPLTSEGVRKWRARNPDGMAWIRTQLEEDVRHEKPLVMAVALRLAKQGSPAHLDWLAKVCGWYPATSLYGRGEALRTGVNQRPDGSIEAFTVVIREG